MDLQVQGVGENDVLLQKQDVAHNLSLIKTVQTLLLPDSKVPERFRVQENTRIAVSADSKRYGLSEIVNTLLGNEKGDHTPFDFLLNGQFLRTSLREIMTAELISPETTLEITYILANRPPEVSIEIPHPDWISSIDARNLSKSSQTVVSGCYDGIVRVWKYSSDQKEPVQLLHEGKSHSGGIKYVCSFENNEKLLISSSLDKTLKIWCMKNNTLECIYECIGHGKQVDAIATMTVSDTESLKFASGGWDNTIKLWSVPDPSEETPKPKKSKKIDGHSESTTRLNPVVTLAPHKEPISCLCWPHPLALYSASNDRTMRQWDTQTGDIIRSWSTVSTSSSLSFSEAHNLLLSSHSDKFLRIWDARIGQGSALKNTLRSHTNSVTSASWGTEGQFVSTSRDGSMKLWDLRSSVPLASVQVSKEGTVPFCVDWVGQFIVSGSQDCQMRFHAPFAA